MATPSERGRFWSLYQAWKSHAPEELARQNPLLILALLESCKGSGGRFQLEFRSEFHLSESHLSKLVDKLIQAGWIFRGSARGAGSRVRITEKGLDVLEELSETMGTAPAARPARRRSRREVPLAEGQLRFDLGVGGTR